MGVVAGGSCVTFGCVVGLWLLLGGVRGQDAVTATVGEDATLPCSYDAAYYGPLPACWGRGPIPSRGCNDEVLSTDGSQVLDRLSERYRLGWAGGTADVSLTVVRVRPGDAGVYGCRVAIPGWFNDQLREVTLRVVTAPPHPVRLQVGEVKAKTITVSWTPGPDGGSPITGYRIDFKERAKSWDAALTSEGISPALTQVTLIDVRPNKRYDVRMFAHNERGLSEASDVITVTTKEAAPEGPPLDVQVEAVTPRSIKLTWKPPKMELRHGVLLGYSISYRGYDAAGGQFGRWDHQSAPASGDLERALLGALRPRTRYAVQIQARTAAGLGPAAAAPPCSTPAEAPPPPPPQVPAASTQDPATAATTFEQIPTTFEQIPTTFEQISTTFEQIATTFEQISTTFSPVAPDPPVLELLEVKDAQVSLRWTPGVPGAAPVSSFDLEYKEGNASWDSAQSFGGYGPNQTETTIIEMRPSTYSIRAFARSGAGSSRPSNVVTVVIAERRQERDRHSTLAPVATQAAVAAEDGPGIHRAVIAVPALLLAVVVGLVAAWRIRRTKRMKGLFATAGFTRAGFTGDAARFVNSEPLSELL